MATLTPKIGLKKPSPNVELDWGFRWNENADILDEVVLSTNLSDAGNVTIIDDGAGNITISGTAASVAGASHADLSDLDYASAGHTGFASAAELLTVSGFLTDHGNLSGLTDDDHTQYVLADGTRSFTGNVTIDNPRTLTVSGIKLGYGTVSEPSITFTDDPDTGFYRGATNDTLVATVGGVAIVAFQNIGTAEALRVYRPVWTDGGSAGNPRYSFNTDPDTGMYLDDIGVLGFSTVETVRVLVSGVGDETDGVGVEGNLTVTGSVLGDKGDFVNSLTVSGIPVVTAVETPVTPLLASVLVDAPNDEEDITIMKAPQSFTLQKMFAVLRGPGTPSVTWTVRHDANRAATGTEVVTAGTTTTSTTHGDEITSMDNPTITGGSWVWLETTVTGGSPQELTVELYA